MPRSYKCDDIDDCGDNSDEEGCGTPVAISVGSASLYPQSRTE